jgi:YidC/Oxa1 family membrane protein insertase
MQGTKGAAIDPQQQQMQMFTKFMPLMLMFFAFSFPIGVVFYWLTTNVLTILQQQFILGNVATSTPAKPAPGPRDGSASTANGPGKLAKKPPSKPSPGNGAAARSMRSQANKKKKKK